MGQIEVKTQGGDVVGTVALDPSVFEVQVNVPVMHQAVRAQRAAARSGTHATKTRGAVSGGGRKPWRQKGTGRARQGSTRAPQWAGGGVVFGPHPRDHSVKLPKKMRALALRSALSDRAREGKIAVVDRFDFDAPRTKAAKAALEALGASGRSLVVLEGRDELVAKSFRNLLSVRLISVDQLNTYDVLASDWLVFTRAALDRVAIARKTGKDTGRDEAAE